MTKSLFKAISLILFCCNFSYADQQISISNLDSEVQKALSKEFNLNNKDKYSLKEIDLMMKWLHKKSNNDIVQVIKNANGVIEFKIIPTVRVKSILIKGTKAVSESDALSYFNVKSGDLFDSNQLIESAAKLQKLYQDIGFNNAKIELSFPSTEKNLVDVEIEVIENKRTFLKSIKIISNNTSLNQKLENTLKGKINAPFTDNLPTDIQKGIREYLTENHYFRSEITGPEVLFNSTGNETYLTYKIDKTVQSSVVISGARSYSVGRLEDVIDIDNFYSSNPNVANEMGNRIKNFYLSKGFARIEVNSQEMPGKDANSSRIQIDIEEGPQVHISQIEFTGRLSKKSSYYADLLKSVASSLIQDGYYNKTDLETSLNNLKITLQNQGYLLAKTVSTRTQYNKQKDQLSIFINFDEGPLTELTEIQFAGNKSIASEQLLSELDLKIGDPLQLNKLQAAIQKLKIYYQENGYLEMTLLNENQEDDLVKYDESNTKAQVRFNIFEGPKVEVASILIEGNSFTREKIIHLELEFKQHDVLTPSKIEESISRLQRTGYFNTVEIKTLEEKTNVSQRTVQIRVTERDPGLFTMGIGATNERIFTVRGFTGLAYNNLYGTGRGISARVEGNYNVGQIRFLETKSTINYVEPYLLDTRVRLRGSATLSKKLSDLTKKVGTDLNQYIFSLEKDFTSHVTGFFDMYNLAQTRDFNIETRDEIQRTDIASIGPTIEIDYRDHLFNPTKGTFTRLNFEYGSPQLGSKTVAPGLNSTIPIEYYLATASFTHYYPINSRWVWANSFKTGYLENLNKDTGDKVGVPYDKKGFILGGRATIRGFDLGADEVLPSKEDLGITDDNPTYYLKTNANMNLIKSELRFPLYNDLGGNVFYDGGMVNISGLNISDNYRDAIGIGIRYITPLGSVNLEVGQKLDRKANEDLYRLHLSIGSF